MSRQGGIGPLTADRPEFRAARTRTQDEKQAVFVASMRTLGRAFAKLTSSLRVSP